jgi:predicted ribosomally synthesized peptide with nif11-like leader
MVPSSTTSGEVRPVSFIGGSPLLLNGDQDLISTEFAMSQNDAAEFLKKLDTDTAMRSKVAEGYRRLLIETGREAGLEFTSEDLRNAAREFRQGSYLEISDADLAMIAGGQIDNNSTYIINYISNCTIT